MKRIFSLILTGILISMNIPQVYAENISDIRLQFEDRQITVTAKTERAESSYAIMIVKDGGNAANPEDVFDLTEAISDSEKNISCSLTMPDKRKGENTDGKYVVRIKGKNSSIEEYPFYYVTEDGKAEAKALLLNAGSETELLTYLDSNSEYRNAYISSGLVFEDYDSFTDEEKAETCKIFKNSMTSDKLAEQFNESVIITEINNANDVGSVLEKTNNKFEGILYKDSSTEVKNFLAEQIKKNRKYDTTKSFDDIYNVMNVLYLCNHASYNNIGTTISKYAGLIGIENESAYKSYNSLSGSKKQKASETIVLKLAGNASSVNELLSAISAGVSAAASSKDNDSSVVGGSGNNTGNKSVVHETKPITQNDTETDTKTDSDGFNDLSGFPWAEKAINSLFKKQIVSGVGDGMYDPYGMVTREAFVKMVVLAKGKYNESLISDYDDVERGAWYESYIASAKNAGLVNGISDTTFGVGSEIRRQDAAVIIARSMDNIGTESDYRFNDDGEISNYAKSAVYGLYEAGIINGMDNGLFEPKGNLTRAQAAVMIYNMLNYNPDTKGVDDTPNTTVSKYAGKLNMLKAFGFLKGIDEDKFDDEQAISAQKFVCAVAEMVTKNEMSDSEAAEYAVSSGLIDKDFDMTGKITGEEAAAVLINAMGYHKLYPEKSALEIAMSIGLFSGVTENSNANLKMGNAIVMLCNALEIPLPVMDGTNEFKVDTNSTIMSVYHDWYEVKGVVKQNENTSLSSSQASAKGTVLINNDAYEVGNTNAAVLLGRNIKGWAYIPPYGNDEHKLIYVEEYKNNIEEIKADYIDSISESSKEIRYFESKESEKVNKVSLSPIVKVIYNGKYKQDFSYNDLNIKSGRLVCIDNDNDGKADVILIEEYTFIVANGISYTNEAIYNVYSTPEKFDVNESNSDLTVYLNGEKIEYTALPEMSVLAIMAGGGASDRIVRIEATDKTISGKVTSIKNTDNKIFVDGVSYNLSECYLAAKKANDNKCTEIKTGNTYKFYLDVFGDIAYAEEDQTGEYQYAYAKNLYKSNAGDEYFMRYLTMDGEWKTSQLANKVRYNKTNSYADGALYNLMGTNDTFDKQLLQIKYNSAGEISAVNTAVERADYVDSSFNKRDCTGTWGVNNFSFSSKIFTADSTKVVRIPENSAAGEDEYGITSRSMFSVDNGYTFTAYDVDNFNTAKVIVIKQAESISSSALPFVVSEIATQVIDDDIVQCLTGIIGENAEYTVTGAKENTFDGVNVGDVIQLSVGANGRVKQYNPLFSVSRYGEKISPSEVNVIASQVAGEVMDVDRTNGRIKLDTGVSGGLVLLKGDSKIAMYDAELDTVKEISLSDVEKGDYLYARLEWSKVRMLYVIRK